MTPPPDLNPYALLRAKPLKAPDMTGYPLGVKLDEFVHLEDIEHLTPHTKPHEELSSLMNYRTDGAGRGIIWDILVNVEGVVGLGHHDWLSLKKIPLTKLRELPEDTILRMVWSSMPPLFDTTEFVHPSKMFSVYAWHVTYEEGALPFHYPHSWNGMAPLANESPNAFSSLKLWEFSEYEDSVRKGITSMTLCRGHNNLYWGSDEIYTPQVSQEEWLTLGDFTRYLTRIHFEHMGEEEFQTIQDNVSTFAELLTCHENVVFCYRTTEDPHLRPEVENDKWIIHHGTMDEIMYFTWKPDKNSDAWYERGLGNAYEALHVPVHERRWLFDDDETAVLKERGVFKFWQTIGRNSLDYLNEIYETSSDPKPLSDSSGKGSLDEPERIPFTPSGADRRDSRLLLYGEWRGKAPIIDRNIRCGWCNGMVRLIAHTLDALPDEPCVCPHCEYGQFVVGGEL